MSIINQNLLLTPEGYQISRSVRLRSSASAYLTRTLASNSTSQTKMTWSGWIKRGTLGSALRNLFFYIGNSAASGNILFIEFLNDNLRIGFDGAATMTLVTTQVFRDTSAWYHIVVSIDTTQATAANRVSLYVNGVQVTAFSTANYPSQNLAINNVATTLQQFANVGSIVFDGYLAEQYFVDGQQLTPSSFGEFDGATGVWKPKKYLGTYGTNGFYLNFSDNSAATAAAIGKDSSGNGNNFTPNNISVTAGATYDSMLDVPTPYADGGNGRGNYAVLNPLAYGAGSYIVNGNLRFAINTGSPTAVSTIALNGGKWYFEVTATSLTGAGVAYIGVYSAAGASFAYQSDGNKYSTASGVQAYGASYTTGDVIGVAYDDTAGTLTFYKNNTSQGVAFSSMSTNQSYCFSIGSGSATARNFDANFGQRPFTYTPPTGFKALNTQNLPDSTIKKGNQYFDVSVWSGDGNYPRSITGLQFQPDLFWQKTRNIGTDDHLLADSVRGVGTTKWLSSNLTAAEGGYSNNANLVSLDAAGFTIGSTGGTNVLNAVGRNGVAWQWKKGATQGFDIVTWTQANPSTLNHSLGVKPAMIIIKGRGTTDNWVVWHQNLTNQTTYGLQLNTTSAQFSSTTLFNSTAPTSTQFTVGTGSVTNGTLAVAYLFSEVAGFSKFGSFTGNGSTDGPFVYCGFRPRYLMVKRTDTAGYNWIVWDSIRDTYNQEVAELYPSLPDAEGNSSTNGRPLDFLSNGFKWRGTNAIANASGGTYIFAAFAESPFKVALAR